ncbi:MAG: thiamine diphosphokinase [Fimbriimonadaceae bacterium]
MEKRILGVLGGNDTPEPLLRFWAAKADILIAADRGADLLLSAGHLAHVAIGDFDSSDPSQFHDSTDIVKIHDQNLSDCDKLLKYITERGHDAVTIIGFEGDRLDHVLAGLGSFLRSPLNIRVILRTGLATLLKGPSIRQIGSKKGQMVSILPLLPTNPVATQGLEWEIKGEHLELGANLSLSNIATTDIFSIEIGSGAVLVIQEMQMESYEGW